MDNEKGILTVLLALLEFQLALHNRLLEVETPHKLWLNTCAMSLRRRRGLFAMSAIKIFETKPRAITILCLMEFAKPLQKFLSC